MLYRAVFHLLILEMNERMFVVWREGWSKRQPKHGQLLHGQQLFCRGLASGTSAPSLPKDSGEVRSRPNFLPKICWAQNFLNPAAVMSELETMIQHPREGRDPMLRSTAPGLLACYPYWVVTCGPCIWTVALETPCPIPHACEQGSAPAMLLPWLAFPVSLAGE